MCYTVKSIDDVRRLVVATRGLSGLSDLPTLVTRACRRMADLVATDLTAIALCDGPDHLVVGAAEGTPATLTDARLPRGSGLGWRALDRSMAATTGNCATESRYRDAVVAAGAAVGVRGLAAVPVHVGGLPLGVLYAGVRERRVSPRTTLLMSEFAASLAPLLVTAARADRAGRLAVEEERQRIALQLHDTAGQLLFQISMSAQEIQRCAAADPEAAVHSARSIQTDAAAASAQLREAMHSLTPVAGALAVTVRRDVAAFATRTGIAAEVVVLGDPAPAGAEVEAVVLSVVREALHNVEKHAGAGAALVSLAYHGDRLLLAVEDDGKGLPTDFRVHPVPGRALGMGIPGLLQRVTGAGGSMDLSGNDDGGASLRVSLPVAAGR